MSFIVFKLEPIFLNTLFYMPQLNKSLERCIAGINLQLLRHKILLGLDDRGKLSCHKVNLCFIYFDTHDCVVSVIEAIISSSSNVFFYFFLLVYDFETKQ